MCDHDLQELTMSVHTHVSKANMVVMPKHEVSDFCDTDMVDFCRRSHKGSSK